MKPTHAWTPGLIRVARWAVALGLAAGIGRGAVGAEVAGEWGQTNTLALRRVTPSRPEVPVYETVELGLELAATYDNPFDPEQIDVGATFTGPAGAELKVNGFLDQPFQRRLEGREERLEAAGPPVWKVRFAPTQPGAWRAVVTARDRSGTVTAPEVRFTATAPTQRGVIRRAARNPRGFAFDDGTPFVAIGENLGWSGGRGTFDFDDWLPALHRAGANWVRIWMCSWNCALEWSRESKGEQRRGTYFGVGRYSLENAAKLEAILDRCAAESQYVMLCFGTYGEFNDGGYFNEGQWKANPYNVANGGPCTKPEEFWTNETARKLYRQRLRYLLARYGARPIIQSWEFWNEAKAPTAWVAEMARFVKGTGEFADRPADPFGHLLSTSYGTPEIWRLPEIDFSQTHHYGKGDVADHAPVALKDGRAHFTFGKPHLLAEFGIDWRAPDLKYDPDRRGVNLHNGLWAALLAGDAGGGMIWWWDNYIHPGNLYAHFTPLRGFADRVPWAAGPWTPVPVTSPATVIALRQERTVILWAQNPRHHWQAVFEKQDPGQVPAHELVLPDLPAGAYRIEWWDTWKGGVTRTERVEAVDGGLRVRLTELATDVAALIAPEAKE